MIIFSMTKFDRQAKSRAHFNEMHAILQKAYNCGMNTRKKIRNTSDKRIEDTAAVVFIFEQQHT